jgi:hypothetical protein
MIKKTRCFWVFPGLGFPFRYFSAREDSYIGKTVRQKSEGKSKNAALWRTIPDQKEMDNLVLSFPGRAQRMMESGETLQKSFIFRFQVVHLSFGVLKIVFSGVVLTQLSNTPRAIKNELLIVCFLLRESDLHRGLLQRCFALSVTSCVQKSFAQQPRVSQGTGPYSQARCLQIVRMRVSCGFPNCAHPFRDRFHTTQRRSSISERDLVPPTTPCLPSPGLPLVFPRVKDYYC